MLIKYIVCFQATNHVKGEKKTRMQFYQFWTHNAAEAAEKAEATRSMLSMKTNMHWIIEGVYAKCNL